MSRGPRLATGKGEALLVVMLVAACATATRPRLVVDGPMKVYEKPDSGLSPGLSAFRFEVDVDVHGRVLRMMADHGATGTILTDRAFDAIHLAHTFANATRVDTVIRRAGLTPRLDSTAKATTFRGDSIFQFWGDFGDPSVIDTLRIGRTIEDAVAITMEAGVASLDPFDGLLGRDILSGFDLEFDLPARMARLYTRVPSGASGGALPKGVTAADCVAAHVEHGLTVDTVGIDSTDREIMRTNPAKRLIEQEDLQLPLVINGHPIDGTFDSGAGGTLMNWAAARTVGLDPRSPAIRAVGSGRLNTFSARTVRIAAERPDTVNYEVAGLTFSINGRPLPADTVMISDLTFADDADYLAKPMILVGLAHFRDRILFLSYSSGRVCVTQPSAVTGHR